MIKNIMLNGSWWFSPTPLDFLIIVVATLFVECFVMTFFGDWIGIKYENIWKLNFGVVIANLVTAFIGYIIFQSWGVF